MAFPTKQVNSPFFPYFNVQSQNPHPSPPSPFLSQQIFFILSLQKQLFSSKNPNIKISLTERSLMDDFPVKNSTKRTRGRLCWPLLMHIFPSLDFFNPQTPITTFSCAGERWRCRAHLNQMGQLWHLSHCRPLSIKTNFSSRGCEEERGEKKGGVRFNSSPKDCM